MKTNTVWFIGLLFFAVYSKIMFAKTLLLVDFDQTLTEGDVACDLIKECTLKPEAVEFLKYLNQRTERDEKITWYIWTNNFKSVVQKTLEKYEINLDNIQIIDAEIPGGKSNWADSEIQQKAYCKVIIVDDDTNARRKLLGITDEFLRENIIELHNITAKKRVNPESPREDEFWINILRIAFDDSNITSLHSGLQVQVSHNAKDESCCCCYLQ